MALLSSKMYSSSVVMTGHYVGGLMGLLLAVMESLRYVLYVDPKSRHLLRKADRSPPSAN